MVNDMAKKKKTSSENSKSTGYSVELTGLVLILIGLIGFGFGPVGALIKKFAMFLMGEWWPFILIFVLICGFYMLIKRKLPNFFSARYIGFYLLAVSYTHLDVYKRQVYEDYVEIAEMLSLNVSIGVKETTNPVYVSHNPTFIRAGTAVELKSRTANTTIYYKNDGSETTTESNCLLYTYRCV